MVALECIQIAFNFGDRLKAGDDTTQQSIHLHDRTAAEVYVARINFTGQSARSTGIRSLVEEDRRKISGAPGSRDFADVRDDSQIKP